jgi:hypothetical protein
MKNKAISHNYLIETITELLSIFKRLQVPSPFPADTEPSVSSSEISEKLLLTQSFTKKSSKPKPKQLNKRKSDSKHQESTDTLASSHFVRLYQGNANARKSHASRRDSSQ